jgi:hypothetical protein
MFSDKLQGLNVSPSVNTFEPARFDSVMATPTVQTNSALAIDKAFADALPAIQSSKTLGHKKQSLPAKEPSADQIKQHAFDYKRRDSQNYQQYIGDTNPAIMSDSQLLEDAKGKRTPRGRSLHFDLVNEMDAEIQRQSEKFQL